MLSTNKTFSSIQWDADGNLWVRENVHVLDGNTEISRTFLRTSYAPGSEIPADAPSQVRAVAALAWTPEVLAAYQAKHQPVPVTEE